MKLWAGRLTGQVDERLNELNASIGFDSRMYRQDIRGSMAHAAMLGKIGVLTPKESAQIAAGLQGILDDIESGALEIDMTARTSTPLWKQSSPGASAPRARSCTRPAAATIRWRWTSACIWRTRSRR